MSIWQSINGTKYLLNLTCKIQRIVEGQSYLATRRLVDSKEEQEILEEEIEKSKPPYPQENSKGRLNYLLFTPFRYPLLLGGGRFHTREEQSIFYGAIELKTAMAEIAYKRFVFRANTDADLEDTSILYTKFVASIKTKRGIDLTKAPFDNYTDKISNPLSHAESQLLGTEMRKAEVEAFLFFSARMNGGINCGVISPEAFSKNFPEDQQDWHVFESKDVVEFRLHLPLKQSEIIVFHLKDFLVGGSLPLFT